MCLIASCPLSGKMTDDEYSPNTGSKKRYYPKRKTDPKWKFKFWHFPYCQVYLDFIFKHDWLTLTFSSSISTILLAELPHCLFAATASVSEIQTVLHATCIHPFKRILFAQRCILWIEISRTVCHNSLIDYNCQRVTGRVCLAARNASSLTAAITGRTIGLTDTFPTTST